MSDNTHRKPAADAPHVDPSGVRVWCQRDPVSGIEAWIWENPDTGAREELVNPDTLPFSGPAAAEQIGCRRDAPFVEYRKDRRLTVDRETGLLVESTRDTRRVFAVLAGGAVAHLEESVLRPQRPDSRGRGRRPGADFPWVKVAKMRTLICIGPDDEASINEIAWAQVSWAEVAKTRARICSTSGGDAGIREAAWAQVLPEALTGRERARARKDRLKVAEMDRIRKAYEVVAEVWPQGLGLKVWLMACRDAEQAETEGRRAFLPLLMGRAPGRAHKAGPVHGDAKRISIWFPRDDASDN